MKLLDERFLEPHPRTKLWWDQRPTCMDCKHMRENAIRKSAGKSTSSVGGGMYCLASPGGGETGYLTCISARDDKCGADAKLFEAKDGSR